MVLTVEGSVYGVVCTLKISDIAKLSIYGSNDETEESLTVSIDGHTNKYIFTTIELRDKSLISLNTQIIEYFKDPKQFI